MHLRLYLRLLAPLLLILALGGWLAMNVTEELTERWFLRDLGLRGSLIANAQSDTISKVLDNGQWDRIHALFERTIRDERLSAIALCSTNGLLMHRTKDFPTDLDCAQAHALQRNGNVELTLPLGKVMLGIFPVSTEEHHIADLVLLHDLAFVERRTRLSQQYLLVFMLMMGLTVALLIVLLTQYNWRRWNLALRTMLNPASNTLAAPPEFRSFMDDLRTRLRDLEDHYRHGQYSDADWTAERLRSLLASHLHGDELLVVSNREPWTHERIGDALLVRQPASGLVTALEPVLQACSGTWIAHGSGNADRECVDAADHLMLPPGQQDYRLRRLWLSEEEVRGYYDGLSNEGIWALCHLAHVRPVFREADWQHYRQVNQRFADAVIAEARSHNPVVLVQDYQLALVPALIRQRLPEATILCFWHIPWPTPEAFGICPWRTEILQGLLGSTILGFQTRHHQQNFLATVERFLEARLETERSSVFHAGRETLVDSYPISIAWPATTPDSAHQRQLGREALGITAGQKLILGVDRFDYTKGIEEKFIAFERLLEKHPEWIGRLCLLQLAAPTRSSLADYAALSERVARRAMQINNRFGRPGYTPVTLLVEHRDQAAVRALYGAADVCVVSSLHDGMNLVCKEFAAARDDEQGVLVLSSFAGAARELGEALSINPYHTESFADTLQQALCMHPAEQRERMSSLRRQIHDANVYLWAGRMLEDAARWRLQARMHERLHRYQHS
ncbi:trehalose-6-phosphate synthase [Uliginosibacterium sp. 31-12]|uniref:alpha,alpha-trehalose-phosphate synthase (UDP-forming) n=1 Tax=Uliginosibacterium sp. 31-12 TaxID=3062781 RepID=UPI0026E2D827|nr:trehalose-6-phosphate synthase [Uliginosibacterium sp. 31-12]MDO6386183.1 trehalose-6-phosphate synthase [Uliginosibacterium sp. 31-12]